MHLTYKTGTFDPVPVLLTRYLRIRIFAAAQPAVAYGRVQLYEATSSYTVLLECRTLTTIESID